jgi:hypothetical protein
MLHHTPCSLVTIPSPTELGVRGGQEGPRQAATHARGHPTVLTGGADRYAPFADLFQPPDSAALTTRD